MSPLLEQRLRQIDAAGGTAVPTGGLTGLEKESLRVDHAGRIATTPHPPGLGSPLTNPWFTTDYSEALLELITPPAAQPAETLDFLRDAHTFAHRQLAAGETLWPASMPCIIETPEAIPVARYGTSNAGQMKSVYRVGLGHRYGRMMQVISGVHFNYSAPAEFWPAYREIEQDHRDLRAFTDHHYFGMIRNLQRFGWVIPYLFGASPAVCNSFLANQDTCLKTLPGGTRYEPWATSLRMGDIGYTNRKKAFVEVTACYDTLQGYVRSLRDAISTPCEAWESIGVRGPDGSYRQLNANILQIENEYYSTIRPKQIQGHLEKPVDALSQRGVRYVELRSLDLDPFEPLGVDEEKLRFLEIFMIYCLLEESPPIRPQEREFINRNIEDTAHFGRAPGFRLARKEGPIPLSEWLQEILGTMGEVAALLDSATGGGLRTEAVQRIASRSAPEATPSARILRELQEQRVGFHDYTRDLAERHQGYFRAHRPAPDRERTFAAEVERSRQEQTRMEHQEEVPFPQFLSDYFAP